MYFVVQGDTASPASQPACCASDHTQVIGTRGSHVRPNELSPYLYWLTKTHCGYGVLDAEVVAEEEDDDDAVEVDVLVELDDMVELLEDVPEEVDVEVDVEEDDDVEEEVADDEDVEVDVSVFVEEEDEDDVEEDVEVEVDVPVAVMGGAAQTAQERELPWM